LPDERESETPQQSETVGRVEGLVDDAFGIDFKVPRTIRDLVIQPGKVFDAAAASDYSRYTRPLRLFLALTALQFLIFGLAGATEGTTFGGIFEDQPAALSAVESRLAAAGSSVEVADEIIRKWLGWLNWPLTIMLSLAFVLVFWMLRSSLGLFRSFMLYLTAVNASTIATLPFLLIAALVGPVALSLGSFATMLVFLAYAGVVMHSRAADTALGLSMRLAAICVVFVPIVIAFNVLAVAILELALRMEIGVSWFELLIAGMQAAD
jgi:hypothetical protein